jgi:uncharacterized membrane protein
MPAVVVEWLQLLLRWTHVIAGIMWIGDSFLFMWMDRSLEPPSRPREGDVAGELWMVHSGGFYEVVKRRTLAPGGMPARLHWFKWQAYTTWLSGFALLVVVYWLGGAAFMVDRAVLPMTAGRAMLASALALVLAWRLYDTIWLAFARAPRVAMAISFALLGAAIVGLTRVFGARAAFLHAGATMGTIMAANVIERIIPAQNQMISATRAGRAADPAPGARAKQRSIHNHYLTLPVIFCMLSPHFPEVYGHPQAALLLALFVVVGMVSKYVMNAGRRSHKALIALGLAAFLALAGLTARPAARPHAPAAPALGPVSFGTARAIVERRCMTCHSRHPSNPSFPEPPAGVTFDDPERMVALAPRMQVRAVETRTMPLGNLTGMTDAERDTLAAWIAGGAKR